MPAIARSEPFREQACPLAVCDGSGWILGPENVARPCECRADRLRKSRARGVASAIPARYRGVSFDRPPVSDMDRDLKSRAVVQAVREFCENLDGNLAEGQGLWLMGSPGTGKTTLGMLIASRALAAGKTTAVYFSTSLLNRIRQTYYEAAAEDAYSVFFEKITSVDLLYIDDLGSERQTDWVVEQLYAVVNERYESQRSILLTSNADQDIAPGERRLREQIGARTVSRLLEMSGPPLPLFGPDRRIHA
jgi:DNA replication protein DnaC